MPGNKLLLRGWSSAVKSGHAAVAIGVLVGGPEDVLIAVVGIAATHMMSNYVAALKSLPSASMGAPGAGRPQARISDMHVCQMVTGLVPHVGGPIAVGCPTVIVGGMPAARIGDMAICTGPPDFIAMGSATVIIGGSPAARIGDITAHGGSIVTGYPTVSRPMEAAS